jgi:Caspase domain
MSAMTRRSTILIFVVACLALGSSQVCHAEKRAFVVGVNGYQAMPPLKTAINDATAVGKALTALNFVVTTVHDPGQAEFEEKWREFLNSLNVGDAVAFYFAGHGVQIDGANYLLLKDSPGPDGGEKAVLDTAADFHELMQRLELRGLAASLYILDACRNNPISDNRVKADRGQARGLARIESVYGAFVMYSAGPDEEALDYLRDDRSETNSVYVRRLLPLLSAAELSLVDIAKRVQIQVEQDAKSISRTQRPAYFDGIIGQFYLNEFGRGGKPLEPTDRIVADNVIRLAAFATWDSSCQSRPPPRLSVVELPKYGRIVTRSETVTVNEVQFGNACNNSTQKAVGLYYFIDEANKASKAAESVKVAVKHWSISPSTTVNETFEVDLATKFSKRTTRRP